MRDVLQEALQTTVIVENDVNLAVLGEHWQGRRPRPRHVRVHPRGTGIGAGILIDGALHSGPPLHGRRDRDDVHGPAVPRTSISGRGAAWRAWPASRPSPGGWPDADGRDPREWLAEMLDAAEAGDPRAVARVDDGRAARGHRGGQRGHRWSIPR
jgi:hypothetical protein